MIRSGFLTAEERRDLIDMARNGTVEHRLARRANALVLLDRGVNCQTVGEMLLVDDDTVRTWWRLHRDEGLGGLTGFSYRGSTGELDAEQQEKLKAWVSKTLPRTTREVGAWIEQEFGIVYESRSGLIKLLHRLGMERRKPEPVSSKITEEKQQGFTRIYYSLLNSLLDDEAVLFADAVHPTCEARPVGCWAPKDTKIAIDQTSGRERLNIHGAIDLETGKTKMIEVLTVDALSTIMLLLAIENMYPDKRVIHVFLDNARYHHAKMVAEWLSAPGRRIKLHFVPAYCPHLNPIERLWGLMHRNITHNRHYRSFREFCNAALHFLKEEVPQNWGKFCDNVSDNFRVISPQDYRILN